MEYLRFEDVVETAREIRSHLHDLVGEEAADVERQLDELVSRAEAGQATKDAILLLLSSHESTRLWAAGRLEEKKNSEANRALPSSRHRCTLCGCDLHTTEEHPTEDPGPPQRRGPV
jgi:hypothetical protein